MPYLFTSFFSSFCKKWLCLLPIFVWHYFHKVPCFFPCFRSSVKKVFFQFCLRFLLQRVISSSYCCLRYLLTRVISSSHCCLRHLLKIFMSSHCCLRHLLKRIMSPSHNSLRHLLKRIVSPSHCCLRHLLKYQCLLPTAV